MIARIFLPGIFAASLTLCAQQNLPAVLLSDVLQNNTSATQETEMLALKRGPYLQIGTPTSMTIKWETDVNSDSKVTYGTSVSNLNLQVTNSAQTKKHEIQITGLNAATVYYYTIGTTSAILSSASATQYFKTSPVTGTLNKFRFWAIGDAGTDDANQEAVRDAFLTYNNGQHIDGWIMLGDNAYNSGFDGEYQDGIFENMYEPILENTVLWPAPGNHDYNNHIPFSPSPAYYDIFTLPTAAEAGGVASGTEKYYSYNYGNIHFVVLDSYDEGTAATDPMVQWLQNDLAANTQQWLIAYFHHPPYTKGTHDSDNPNFLDGELPEIRQNIIPILESFGVDLVLNGHSHVYERSFQLDGHYGYSNQLQPSMILDNTSGNYPTVCPFQKHDLTNKSHKGTNYVVCGCSGKNGSTASGWPHPVMYNYDNTVFGSMIIEVDGNRLDAKFITSTNTIADEFTIIKNASKKQTLYACPGDQLVLKPSWQGNVEWFPTLATTDSLVVTASVSTVYFANEPLGCMSDTFLVNILPTPPCVTTSLANHSAENRVAVFPTIAPAGTAIVLQYNGTGQLLFNLFDVSGKMMKNDFIEAGQNNNSYFIKTEGLEAGIYFISLQFNGQSETKKIIITN